MTGQLIHEKSAKYLASELQNELDDHRMTMALFPQIEKAGKVS